MKKAQGLSITTIIVAVIALVVLVVLVAIFTGRLAIFGGSVSKCAGICRDPAEGCTDTETMMTGKFSTDKLGNTCKDQICCIPISE